MVASCVEKQLEQFSVATIIEFLSIQREINIYTTDVHFLHFGD